MTITDLRSDSRVQCPDWCDDHETLTLYQDELFETHVSSIGRVLPSEEADTFVDVRIAAYRFIFNSESEHPASKLELRHGGQVIILGAAETRVLAGLLLVGAELLGRN